MINRIKLTPLIIVVIVIIVGLVGTIKGFTTSATTATKQTTTLANYEQDGTFNYKAYMDPAYYYGTDQTVASSPSIPVQFINSITMNYQYSSPYAQVQVQVDAVIQNSAIWQKTVSIVPQESEPGDFNINFPVDINSLQTTIDGIQKSLGLSATGYLLI